MSKVSLNLVLNREIDDELEAIAASEGTTKGEIMRQAFSVVKMFREQAKKGRTHIGFVADASKLDMELLGILGVTTAGVRNAGTR